MNKEIHPKVRELAEKIVKHYFGLRYDHDGLENFIGRLIDKYAKEYAKERTISAIKATIERYTNLSKDEIEKASVEIINSID